MDNVIHKEKIESFLERDGNIIDLVSRAEKLHMNKLIMTNKTNWEKILSLPEYVYKSFDSKMRQDCFVSEVRFTEPPSSGPHIEFFRNRDKLTIKIDSDNTPSGMAHYRRSLTIVAYYIGVIGDNITAEDNNGFLSFADEDWIILSMAARYSLMPPKYIQKIYLLTQMNMDNDNSDENDQSARGRSFISSFIDNLVFQTHLPEWVVTTRLHEHAFADRDFSQIIRKRSLDEMIDESRANEHYTAPLV